MIKINVQFLLGIVTGALGALILLLGHGVIVWNTPSGDPAWPLLLLVFIIGMAVSWVITND